jgi:NAD+ kinase
MSECPHVAILRNPSKPDARQKMTALVDLIGDRAKVIATGVIDEAVNLRDERLDRVFVLGGDGSVLSVTRALNNHQSPIIGVNFGKLGYMAEFSFDEIEAHLDAMLTEPGLISHRMMMDCEVTCDGDRRCRSLAVNDVVVHAGPPFRMIELAISVNGTHLTSVFGDGLVLATPNGSTAHNLSVGGPIMQSAVRALAITPISPHSLTHQPLVVEGDSVIDVVAKQANEGTTAVVDGQESWSIHPGDRLRVRRSETDFLLVQNPIQPRWFPLTKKLKWGQ